MDPLSQAALAGGLALGSGMRLYATVFIAGLLQRTGYLSLPEPLMVLSHEGVIAASALLMAAEFVADKVPAFDSFWDLLQGFVRVPAGAVLAWGSVAELDPTLAMFAALAGGGIAGTAHASKTGSRMAINTSPEPFSNWGASVAEDGLWAFCMWLMVAHPLVFLALLLVLLLGMIVLIRLLWRFLRAALRRVRSWFGKAGPSPA
ncbi:MAG: DUF4126 domain-containing protein [Xanthomonadales bacterium]|jgi:hypothetical protein|nr:DUF4126 domain-containing protein [Xanthomonadales bacterium]